MNPPVNSLSVFEQNTSTAVQEFVLPIQAETPRFRHLTDPIHNRMKNHPLYGKRIQLRSVHGKTGQPVHVEPTHARGRDTQWLGIPRLSPEHREQMLTNGYDVAVPGESFVDIPDGFEIDLGTEVGLYLWEWVQFAPQIVEMNDQFDPEKPHEGADKELFIIIPSEEIEKRAKSFTDRTDAANWIQTLSPRKWYDLARVIGSGMDGGTPLDLFNYLMDVAEKTPKRILTAKNDNQFDQKLLIKRLVDADIIQQLDGAFRYGQIFMGTDEEQVIHFMSQDKHADVVSYMRSALGIRTGLGNVPVKANYATYTDAEETSAMVRDQALQGSSVTEQMKKLAARQQAAATEAATNSQDLDNNDLGDDYNDEDPTDLSGDSLPNIPPVAQDNVPGQVATALGAVAADGTVPRRLPGRPTAAKPTNS